MKQLAENDLLQAYVQDGLSLEKCADKFGWSIAGIWKRLRMMGVDTTARLGSGKRGKSKGSFRHSAGYIYLYAPTHPTAKKVRPYVLQHRLVMEQHLGRYLRKNEVVHHENGIRNDNRIENLVLTTQNGHMKRHFDAFSSQDLSERGRKAALIRWSSHRHSM